MTMFLHEFKSIRKQTVIWSASLSLLAAFFLSLYPAFTSDVETTRKIFEGFPPAVLKAIGADLDLFFTIFGFYSYVFLYVSLIGAIQAMTLGTGIVSKEVSGKTAEFLLTKPVTRNKVLTSKFLAAFISIILTNFVFVATSVVMAEMVSREPFSFKIFLLVSGTLILIQTIFLALGFLVSVSARKIKSPVSVSLPVVFVFFIVAMLDSVIGLENARYLTPFKFYDPKYIIEHSAYQGQFLLYELLLVVAMVALSYIVYNVKDIDAVA